MPTIKADNLLIEAALIGLQQKQAEVEERIVELRARLGNNSSPAPAKKTRKPRRLSPAARKRIADATKKRWAEFRANKEAAAAGPGKRGAGRRGKKSAAAAKSKEAGS